MDYYDPDTILNDAQKVPLTFELDVPLLTPLNNGSVVEHGTKLDLPLWLAEMLAVSRPSPSSSSFGSLGTASALNDRVMNALRADAKSVDIRAQAQWYYELGQRMLELFDEDETAQVLTDTFKKRALEIVDKAQNTRAVQQGGSGDFMSTLDETERKLFRAAHEGSNSVKKWLEHTSRM